MGCKASHAWQTGIAIPRLTDVARQQHPPGFEKSLLSCAVLALKLYLKRSKSESLAASLGNTLFVSVFLKLSATDETGFVIFSCKVGKYTTQVKNFLEVCLYAGFW